MIGHIGVVDYDVVEMGNLHRQVSGRVVTFDLIIVIGAPHRRTCGRGEGRVSKGVHYKVRGIHIP